MDTFIAWWDQTPVAWIVLGVLIGIIAIGFYFLPTIVARKRKHNNALAIFILNLFMLFTAVVLSYLCCVMLIGFMDFFTSGKIDFYSCILALAGIAVITVFLSVFIYIVLGNKEDERKIGVYQALFALIYVLWMAPYVVDGNAYYGMKISFWCMALLVVLGDVMYRSVPESRCRVKY